MKIESSRYQTLLYALKSNWLHLVGFYLAIETMMVVLSAIEVFKTHNINLFLFQVLFSAPLLMFTYGLIFIGGFYLVLLLVDIVIFSVTKGKAITVVLTEWLLIAPIFIYWAVTYQYWLWVGLVTSFLITQVIRARKIERYNLHSID